MAQITTVAMQAFDVKQYVGSITDVAMQFNVTALAAVVTNGDRIKICTLPANAKIIGGSLKITGTSGITGLIALQSLEPTSNVIFLSPTTLAPSVAIATLLTQPHAPITSVTGTRDLEIVVATGTFSNTTAGQIVFVDVQYAFTP